MMNNELFNIITLQEASEMWEKDDSTLRRVITGPQFVEGVDYRKTGKMWLIKTEAMERVYGPAQMPINQSKSIGKALVSFFKKIIRIEQDYGMLSGEQLKRGFIDSLEYIIAFNDGMADSIRPDLPKEKAIDVFIDSLNLMLCEFKKRDISKIDVFDEFYGDSVTRSIILPGFDIQRILTRKMNYKSAPMSSDGINFITNRLSDNNIAIIGQSGCGKTILAKLLAEKYAEQGEKVLLIYNELSSKEYQDTVEYLKGVMVHLKVFVTPPNGIKLEPDITRISNGIWDNNLICIGFSTFNEGDRDSITLKILDLAKQNGVRRVIFDYAEESFFKNNADYFIDKCGGIKMLALFQGDEPFDGKKEGRGFKRIFKDALFMNTIKYISSRYLEHYCINSEFNDVINQLKRGTFLCLYDKCQEPVYAEIKMTEEQYSRYCNHKLNNQEVLL